MAEYIEREAFIADKRWLYCTDCDRRKGKKRGKYVTLYEIGEAPCKSCWVGDMLDETEVYPAADVKPVARGEWVNDNDGLPVCSACGEIALQRIFVKVPHLIQDVRMVLSNYCPNCGARMVNEDI